MLFASNACAVSVSVAAPAIAESGDAVMTTLATGTGLTVISSEPVTPSTVAVIVAVPALTPVTRPVVALTVATPGVSDDHVAVRPVRTLLDASFATNVICVVAPAMIVADPALTVTDATGTGLTVISSEPVTPSTVAVIVAVPALTAVTRPVVALTVATAGVFDDQAAVRPVSTLLDASFATNVICVVAPTMIDDDPALTVTDTTGTTVTVTVAVPVLPSLVAVITDVPTATPFTSPVAEFTLALAGVPDDHVIVRPVSVLPPASLSVATNVVESPTAMLAADGDTVTVLTGTGTTVTVEVPTLPSLVALIVVVPVVSVVTTPLCDTLATAGALDAQVTARPVSTPP